MLFLLVCNFCLLKVLCQLVRPTDFYVRIDCKIGLAYQDCQPQLNGLVLSVLFFFLRPYFFQPCPPLLTCTKDCILWPYPSKLQHISPLLLGWHFHFLFSPFLSFLNTFYVSSFSRFVADDRLLVNVPKESS